MSGSRWQQGTDETLGIRRQRDVGLVVQNAELHLGIVTQQKSNSTPYYDRPGGSSHNTLNTVANGDVLFTIAGLSARIGAMTGGGGGERHNSNKIRCVSSLGGLGRKGDANTDALLESLQFQGIAEQGTEEQGNGSTMFNAIKGGILTLTNICKETIEEGDPLEIWLPLKHEIKDGKGKNRTQADLNGVVKPWLRPFHPSRHRASPKSIYQCLTEPDAEYTENYRRTCNAYVDSVVEQAIVVVRATMGPVAANDFYTQMMTAGGKLKAQQKQLAIEALFRRYSVNGVPPGIADPITRFEYESAGKYCYAVGELVHNVNKNVVGRATSAGLPGHFFNCQITSYGAK